MTKARWRMVSRTQHSIFATNIDWGLHFNAGRRRRRRRQRIPTFPSWKSEPDWTLRRKKHRSRKWGTFDFTDVAHILHGCCKYVAHKALLTLIAQNLRMRRTTGNMIKQRSYEWGAVFGVYCFAPYCCHFSKKATLGLTLMSTIVDNSAHKANFFKPYSQQLVFASKTDTLQPFCLQLLESFR